MSTNTSLIGKNLFNTTTISGFIEPILQILTPDLRLGALSSKVTRVSLNNQSTHTLHIKPSRKWKGFTAGQFVQLTVEKDGAYLTRCFSISCSPESFKKTKEITLTIRAHEQGLVTPWIAKGLSKGTRVYLSQVQGDFTLVDSPRKRLFIAGGSGFTPIMSMLQSLKNSPEITDCTLLFYVCSANELFFNAELKELEQAGLKYHAIFTDSVGRFELEHLRHYAPDFKDQDVYICGPGGMIELVKTTCLENGTPESNIFFEHFGVSGAAREVQLGEEQVISIDYAQSNKQHQTQTGANSKTLLELAEDEGLSPTYGCRIGVCHQCICKKKQGRVYNLKTQKISDTGEEEIQLCLSTPLEDVTLEL